MLGPLERVGEGVGVVGREEPGVHPEEALDRVAVLHGGAAVAVDEGPRLLPRHAGAVRDLLLGVAAAVRLDAGASEQVETLQEAGLEVGFAGRPAVEQGLHHIRGHARSLGEASQVEDLAEVAAHLAREFGDAGDGRCQGCVGHRDGSREAVCHQWFS